MAGLRTVSMYQIYVSGILRTSKGRCEIVDKYVFFAQKSGLSYRETFIAQRNIAVS